MANLNRTAFELTARCLGEARDAVETRLGDLARNPGALLALEAAFARLRGATLSHDSDIAAHFLQFGGEERVGKGLQTNLLAGRTAKQAKFQTLTSGSWNPAFYGVPCNEGWGNWHYNAWKSYTYVNDSGQAILTQNPLGIEPNPSERLTYNTAVRRHSGAYKPVARFSSGRWVSIQNTTGSLISSTGSTVISFLLPKRALAGSMAIHPQTGLPQDVRFYSLPSLMQQFQSNAWVALSTTPNQNDKLDVLPYSITSEDANNYRVHLKMPNGYSWQNSRYWHVAILWGTQDDALYDAQNPVDIPAPIGSTAGATSFATTILWPRKNFFRTEVTDQLAWLKSYSSDPQGFLVSRERTHFRFYDGSYSDPEAPSKYPLADNFPAAPVGGYLNSLAGYAAGISEHSAVCFLVCSRNTGTSYDGKAELAIVAGPEITPEFFPADWSECPYYPPVPQDHDVIARLVAVRAPGSLLDTVEGSTTLLSFVEAYENLSVTVRNILQEFSIAYIRREIPTYARAPIGNVALADALLRPMSESLTTLRTANPASSAVLAAFNLLVSSAGVPRQIATNRNDVLDPDETGSKIFRSALKRPIRAALKNSPPPTTPLEFDDPARGLITEMVGLPPSTEMLRLSANHLSLTGERLPVPTELEIFHEWTPQCANLSPDTAGAGFGQDYTLRLELEDSDENVLVKDWYVMASRYFLTDEEYGRRSALGLSNVGYFKRGTKSEQQARATGTLQTIDEFRLHGYAGIVPDLMMGDARTLLTRVVSPPDETKITEEQFRKNLENQGLSQEEIDEAVWEYLFEGGEFYTVDLRQYDNKFVAIRNAAISAAKYSFASTPYWKINLHPYFGFINPDGSTPAATDVRADSFTIAPAGLAAGVLERYGTQALAPLDPALSNTSATGIHRLMEPTLAVKVVTGNSSTSITSVALKLRALLDSANISGKLYNTSNGFLSILLYSSVANRPGVQLAAGGTVRYQDIASADFAEYIFPLAYTLSASTTYWLVVEQSETPLGGRILMDSTGTATTQIVQKYGDFVTPNDTAWRTAEGRPWRKFFASNGDTLLDQSSFTGMLEPILGKQIAIRVPGDMLVESAHSMKLRVRLELDSSNTTGALFNEDTGVLSFDVYDNNAGAPGSLQGGFHIADIKLNSLASGYQEITLSLTPGLTPLTVYYIVITLSEKPKGGTLYIDKVGNPANLLAVPDGDEWDLVGGNVYYRFLQQVGAQVLGAFNRNSYDLQGALPPVNDKRQLGPTYKVEGHWAYTCAPLATPGPIAIYPRAFNNVGTWEYARFSQDIHFCVRFVADGVVNTLRDRFVKSSGWRALWWKRDAATVAQIDLAAVPDSDSITSQINYTNHSVAGATTYINGRLEGVFIPRYSESYTLRVTSSGGFRVYVNGVLAMDYWARQDVTPVTHSIGLQSDTVGVHLLVEHWHATGSQRLLVEWSSASETWGAISPLTANDPTPEPYVISANVERIVYLAVGKTEEELDTPTQGAPPGDIIVVRSV